MACPTGKIRRKAYKIKSGPAKGTRVKSVCVKDQGKPGKGPKTMPSPKAGGLHGWTKDLPASARRKILKRVSAKKGCKSTLGDLNLLANITADKPTKKKARADHKWLHNQGFCKLKTKKKK